MTEVASSPTGTDDGTQPTPSLDTLAPVIGSIVSSAVAVAGRRAPPADVANGLLSALRRVRNAVDDQGGYAMAASIDGAIRTRMMADNLDILRRTGVVPQPRRLPPAGPSTAAAAAILASAVDSCLAVNAMTDDNAPLDFMVYLLSTHLLIHLGGAPEWGDLVSALHRSEATDVVVQASDALSESATLH